MDREPIETTVPTGTVHNQRKRRAEEGSPSKNSLLAKRMANPTAISFYCMPYTCGQCSREFRRLWALTKHCRSHGNAPFYVCPELRCSTEFNLKREFDHHMIIHKPDYKPPKNRIPLHLHYDNPSVVPYPEAIPWCEVKKLRNKHEPDTGQHWVDLMLNIRWQSDTDDWITLNKVWDNVVKGLTVALPKEDVVRLILRFGSFQSSDKTLEAVHLPETTVNEVCGNQIMEQLKEHLGGISSPENKWMCLSFEHDPKSPSVA